MKQAIVTVALRDKFLEVLDMTKDSLKKYANKCHSDFHIITDARITTGDTWNDATFEKFQVKTYLEEYDRVAFIDCDCYIPDGCINLFEFTPRNHFGVCVYYYNDFGNNYEHYKQCKPQWESITGIDFVGGNSGIFVLDKEHTRIFNQSISIDDLRKIHLGEQSYILSMPKYMNIDYFNFASSANKKHHINIWDKSLNGTVLNNGIIHFMGGMNKIDRIKNYIQATKN